VRFAEDVTLFILEEGGVVLCERMQELYALNTTATYIWCCCEEGLSLSQVAALFGRTFKKPLSEAEAYVHDIVSQWRGLGFFADSEKRRRRARERNDNEKVQLTSDTFYLPSTYSERFYRILGQDFRLRFTSSEQEEKIGLDIGEHGMESYSGFQIFITE